MVCLTSKINFRGLTVCFAAFSIWTIVFGTTRSMGIYNLHFQEAFDVNSAAASLPGAVCLGTSLFPSPLVGMAFRKWSHRTVAVVGACLVNIGFFGASFAPNIAVVTLCYGGLSGLGFGIVLMSSNILAGLHFNEHRLLVSSVIMAGIGFGQMCLPFLIEFFVDRFDLRGSLVMLTGTNLQMLVLSMLLFPAPDKDNDNVLQDAGVVITVECAENYNDERLTQHKKTIQALKMHIREVLTLQFLRYLTTQILFNVGYSAFLMFLPLYINALDFDQSIESVALSLLGGGLFVGTLVVGIMSHFLHPKRSVVICATGLVAMGTFMVVTTLVQGQTTLLALCFLIGLSVGTIAGTFFPITGLLLKPEHLAVEFGYVLLANGIGVITGPPLAGIIFDTSGEITNSVYFAGAANLFGVLWIAPEIISGLCATCR